jgi:hypothetical protein
VAAPLETSRVDDAAVLLQTLGKGDIPDLLGCPGVGAGPAVVGRRDVADVEVQGAVVANVQRVFHFVKVVAVGSGPAGVDDPLPHRHVVLEGDAERCKATLDDFHLPVHLGLGEVAVLPGVAASHDVHVERSGRRSRVSLASQAEHATHVLFPGAAGDETLVRIAVFVGEDGRDGQEAEKKSSKLHDDVDAEGNRRRSKIWICCSGRISRGEDRCIYT